MKVIIHSNHPEIPNILTELENTIDSSKVGKNFLLVSWKPLEPGKYMLVMKYYMENRFFNKRIKTELEKMISKFSKKYNTDIKLEYVE